MSNIRRQNESHVRYRDEDEDDASSSGSSCGGGGIIGISCQLEGIGAGEGNNDVVNDEEGFMLNLMSQHKVTQITPVETHDADSRKEADLSQPSRTETVCITPPSTSSLVLPSVQIFDGASVSSSGGDSGGEEEDTYSWYGAVRNESGRKRWKERLRSGIASGKKRFGVEFDYGAMTTPLKNNRSVIFDRCASSTTTSTTQSTCSTGIQNTSLPCDVLKDSVENQDSMSDPCCALDGSLEDNFRSSGSRIGISQPELLGASNATSTDFILPTTVMVSTLWNSQAQSGSVAPFDAGAQRNDGGTGADSTAGSRSGLPSMRLKQGCVNSPPTVIRLNGELDESTASSQSPRPAAPEEESAQRLIHKTISEDMLSISSDAMSLPGCTANSLRVHCRSMKALGVDARMARSIRNQDDDNSHASQIVDDAATWCRGSGGNENPGAKEKTFRTRDKKKKLSRIFLLLISPRDRKFEVIQMNLSLSRSTIGDILDLIPTNSTEFLLGHQKHRGLCRPKDGIEMTNLADFAGRRRGGSGSGRSDAGGGVDGGGWRIVNGEILIAIPEDFTGLECMRMSHQILHNPKLVKLLQKADPFGSPGGRRKSGSASRSRRRSSRSLSDSINKDAGRRSSSCEISVRRDCKTFQHVGIRPLSDDESGTMASANSRLRLLKGTKREDTKHDTKSFMVLDKSRDATKDDGDEEDDEVGDVWDRRRVALERTVTNVFASIVGVLLPDEDGDEDNDVFTSHRIRIASTDGGGDTVFGEVLTARVLGVFVAVLFVRQMVKATAFGGVGHTAFAGPGAPPMGARGALICAAILKTLMHCQHTLRIRSASSSTRSRFRGPSTSSFLNGDDNKDSCKEVCERTEIDYGYGGWRNAANL